MYLLLNKYQTCFGGWLSLCITNTLIIRDVRKLMKMEMTFMKHFWKGKQLCIQMNNVALYGWPEQTIPLSVSARNQTKDFWTWNLAVSGSGKGTRKIVGWTKELAAVGDGSREARQQKSWRGTTDRGSQHRTPETVAEKRGSSHGEEDRPKMSAFELLCGIFASNPR